MLKNTKIYFLLLLLTLASCDLSVLSALKDSPNYDLGDGYFIENYQEDNSVISKRSKEDETSEIIIYGKIIDYRSNDSFIIVFRRDSIETNRYFQGIKEYEEQKGDVEQYWIIDKRKDKIYGPLNKKTFYNARKNLGVPEYLKIK
jgi:hypothetical protein